MAKAVVVRRRLVLFASVFVGAIALSACQPKEFHQLELADAGHSEDLQDDFESEDMEWLQALSCRRANATQIAQVDSGNRKREEFLRRCRAQTDSSPWCDQLVRPNPDSRGSFECTYGGGQPHQLIHPDESTWKYAIKAVDLVKKVQAKGVKVCLIYNWWRPEPYNANVGGAAGRHPNGTSVDVRFCSKAEQNKAFVELCKLRKQGELRALGYYSGTGLHFGVGDSVANTWGRSCP